MLTNIVNIKYEDNLQKKTFTGRTYSYLTDIKLEVGDLVIAPTATENKIARVSEINIPEENVRIIKPYLKTITQKINKHLYLKFTIVLKEVA